MNIWLVVAGVWALVAIAGLWVFRRRHGSTADDAVTPQWLSDHKYRKDGDGRWK